MKFHNSVFKDLRILLREDLQRYVKETQMTDAEYRELCEWVQAGNSPYDNGWYIATDAGTLYIPLAEVIDFEKEKARLTAEQKKNDSEIERIEKKLANEGFVAKAPAAVIDGERAKLRKYLEVREALAASLAKLG